MHPPPQGAPDPSLHRPVFTEVTGQPGRRGIGVKDQCGHSALLQGLEERGTSWYGHQGAPKAAGKAKGRPSLAGRNSMVQAVEDPGSLSPLLV